MKRDVSALAALDDDLRRQMYLEIRQRRRPVSREEVAEAVGVSRKLAAFHLDKLVDRGLLVATYARPPGRGGRGAGRSAKFYAPSDRTFDVSIPERNYDVMGSILVQAIEEEQPGERADVAAQRIARRYGEDLGKAERERRHLPPAGAERAMSVATDVLSTCGYEPYADGPGVLRLRNCPFHAVAQRQPEVICEMNLALLRGVAEALDDPALAAALEPAPGRCCVALRHAG